MRQSIICRHEEADAESCSVLEALEQSLSFQARLLAEGHSGLSPAFLCLLDAADHLQSPISVRAQGLICWSEMQRRTRAFCSANYVPVLGVAWPRSARQVFGAIEQLRLHRAAGLKPTVGRLLCVLDERSATQITDSISWSGSQVAQIACTATPGEKVQRGLLRSSQQALQP